MMLKTVLKRVLEIVILRATVSVGQCRGLLSVSAQTSTILTILAVALKSKIFVAFKEQPMVPNFAEVFWNVEKRFIKIMCQVNELKLSDMIEAVSALLFY